MKQYEVVERVTLTVEPGSVVFLSEQQATAATAFLKEIKAEAKPNGNKRKTD